MNSDHNFEAWCSQHQMPPGECWELHNPRHIEFVKQRAETEEDLRRKTAAQHKELQDQLVQCAKCDKFARDMAEHLSYRCKVAKEERERTKRTTTSEGGTTSTTTTDPKRRAAPGA